MQYPHCDSRILHEPGVCKYCDDHADWQDLRRSWGIAFTGSHHSWRLLAQSSVGVSLHIATCTRPYPHICEENGPCNGWPVSWPSTPCPADVARGPGSPSDHRRWGGNKPTSAVADPSWPAETIASLVMYGDPPGREVVPVSWMDRIKSIFRR